MLKSFGRLASAVWRDECIATISHFKRVVLDEEGRLYEMFIRIDIQHVVNSGITLRSMCYVVLYLNAKATLEKLL